MDCYQKALFLSISFEDPETGGKKEIFYLLCKFLFANATLEIVTNAYL